MSNMTSPAHGAVYLHSGAPGQPRQEMLQLPSSPRSWGFAMETGMRAVMAAPRGLRMGLR